MKLRDVVAAVSDAKGLACWRPSRPIAMWSVQVHTTAEAKNEPLNIGIKALVFNQIDRVAKFRVKSRMDFFLE